MFRFDLSNITRIEKTPKNIALIIAASILFLLAIFMYAYLGTGTGIPATGLYYYTMDNGQTFFSSDKILIPPFKTDSKTVMAAGVFIGADGKPFVAYVYKYMKRGCEILAGLPHVNGRVIDNNTLRYQASQYCLVRKPGEKKWVPWNSPAGQKIVNVRDPATGQPLKPYTD